MVAAVAITRKDYTAEQLRELAKRTKDAGAARRMLALALVLEGKSRSEAATSCGMDRQILCDWAHRYNAAGIAGLYNRTAPGAKPRLSAEQEGGSGRAGSERAGFGRAWCGSLAPHRSRAGDRATLRGQVRRAIGR
jgi:hypothetical protein